MAWANFLILGLGGLLLTVPIVLHFMFQPKPQLLMFPALRFVKEKQQSNRTRMRLRHLLLLLLRCLLIALAALALAGPSVASNDFGKWLTLGGISFSALIVGVILTAAIFATRTKSTLLIGVLAVLFVGHLAYGGWTAMNLLGSDSGKMIGDSQTPIAALVVVDTSPRMTYIKENQSRLDAAKDIGDWLINQFPSDSQVCVQATDADRAFFSVDVGAAKKRLKTFEISYASTSLPKAIDEGLKILEKANQERKEIYVITDLTVRSWVSDDANDVAKRLKNRGDIAVFVLDVGVENATNFSMSEPKLVSSTITESGELQLNTEIKRTGGAAQRTVKLKIEQPDLTRPIVRDGKTLLPEKFWEQTMTMDIRENSRVPVSFQFTEKLPLGVHRGKIEIVGEDGLPVDNERYFTFQVRPSWKILVVHPTNVSPKRIQKLIAPRQDQPGGSIFECTVANQRELSKYEFYDYQTVYFLDPGPLEATQWIQIEKYVESGGGVGMFLGANALNGALIDESFVSPAAQNVLTGELYGPRKRPEGEFGEQWFLSLDGLAHPVLQPFRKIETGIPWYNHMINFHWGIEPDEKNEEFPTQTLVRFSNGEPALIERNIGSGRIMVMFTPVSEPPGRPADRAKWNQLFNMNAWPTWLLIRQITRYLVQTEAETLNIHVGQTATLQSDWTIHPKSYRAYTPDETRAPNEINAPEGSLRYRFTDVPGHYRLAGKLKERIVRGFSANIRNEDTDLARANPDQLDTVLGAGRFQLAREKSEIQRQQGTMRQGLEFYPLLVLMMVVILGVENLMSNRFYNS